MMNKADPDGRDNLFDSGELESLNSASKTNESQEELLESMVEHTKKQLESKNDIHEKLTDYVRENRLPSNFGFENVSHLVRCILESTTIKTLPLDFEECVNWIATRLYEDPLSNERLERLWNSVIDKIQG